MSRLHLPILIVLTCSSLALVPEASRAQTGSITWRYNYAVAREEAKEKGLPIIIDFGTQQCYWCKRLEQDTLSNPTVAKTINQRFVPLKIDAEKEPLLAQALQIQSYPTVVIADSDGKILGTMEGYQDANRFQEKLLRALALVANPEWMIRDYHAANKALAAPDYAKAVTLLNGILEDGRDRPIQKKALKLLNNIEQQAASRLVRARELNNKGQSQEALKELTKLVSLYPGTNSAAVAGQLMTRISSQTPGLAKIPRSQQVRELLAQAKVDYKNQEYLCCLDRCKTIVSNYPDFAEAKEAQQLAAAITSNPEWMQTAVNQLRERLGNMHLLLADSYLKKGKRHDALMALQQVQKLLPGSATAEIARVRLNQLNGTPTVTIDYQKD